MTNTTKETLEIVVKACDDRKAEDIVALDMQGVSILTDYNVITHGNSDRQIGAIAQGVIDNAQENGIDINRIEGGGSNRWILIDLGDVVVHVFNQEERDFYQLEGLWTEASSVNITEWID